MRKALFARAVAALPILMSLASGGTFIGTPSPMLSPKFGTLVNFDDRPTLSLVGANDYVAQGVAVVLELEGLGRFARYPSSQSLANFIGTGTLGERGTDSDDFGFDGTIRFQFASLQATVGIGIAELAGTDLPVLTILNSSLQVIETFTPAFGLNIYAGFVRPGNDIAYFQIKGDNFALDDLQFAPIPEPGTSILAALGLLRFALLFRKRVSATG